MPEPAPDPAEHVERVQQRDDLELDRHGDARALDNLRQVAVRKAQDTVEFVVMFVEGAAGGDESQSHIGL